VDGNASRAHHQALAGDNIERTVGLGIECAQTGEQFARAVPHEPYRSVCLSIVTLAASLLLVLASFRPYDKVKFIVTNPRNIGETGSRAAWTNDIRFSSVQLSLICRKSGKRSHKLC
jgi:hypothetical protein